MKKVKYILCIMLVLMCIFVSKTYAAETTPSSANIVLNGDTSIKNGETGKFTIHINSDKNIGTVSGIISKSNVSNINIQGLNGWSVVYNDATGKFNILKAAGSKSEDIAEITFKVDDKASENIWIKLDDKINLVTTDYQKVQVSGITKKITIPTKLPELIEPPLETVELKNIVVTKKPNKTSYIEGEKFDKTGMKITAQYSDGTKKDITNYTVTPNVALTINDKSVTVKYTENNITKEAKIDINVTNKTETATPTEPSKPADTEKPTKPADQTASTKPIPQTGTGKVMFFILIFGVCTIYISWKKFNKIKIN